MLKAQAIKKSKFELHEIESRLLVLSENPYETKANNLMANLHQLKNDIPKAQIIDVYSGQMIEVVLPENKTWSGYANRLYQKSKNSILEVKELEARKIQTEQNLQKWTDLQPDETQTLQHLRLVEKQLLPRQKAGLEEILPFHLVPFMGFDLLVGKNSGSNDRLLKEFSRPNDLWLHARDLAGSHVIIRNPSKVKVPEQVVNRAAELAAYYSKGKSHNNCPVMITERKFVRKFKGALVGQVKVEREKTIFAQPKGI